MKFNHLLHDVPVLHGGLLLLPGNDDLLCIPYTTIKPEISRPDLEKMERGISSFIAAE